MNIQAAIMQARQLDRAIRSEDWPEDHYIYHGIDNLMRFPGGRPVTWSVAALMLTNYVTTNVAKYHGPLGSADDEAKIMAEITEKETMAILEEEALEEIRADEAREEAPDEALEDVLAEEAAEDREDAQLKSEFYDACEKDD